MALKSGYAGPNVFHTTHEISLYKKNCLSSKFLRNDPCSLNHALAMAMNSVEPGLFRYMIDFLKDYILNHTRNVYCISEESLAQPGV